MKKKKYRIMLVIVAIALFGITFFSFTFEKSKGEPLPEKEPVPLSEAEILIVGDSILGLLRNYSRIDRLIEAQTEATVYNLALGGTSAARFKAAGIQNAELNLAALSKTIKYGSFANIERDAELISTSSIFYVKEVLQKYKTIKFFNIDYILIHYGANDYFQKTPIADRWFYPTEYTFKGALRKGIEALSEACPDAVIILCTPIYCNFEKIEGLEGDSNSMNKGYGTLVSYANAVKDVAEEFDIEYIDGFSELEINEENWKNYLPDGIHPNWKGMSLYSELIIKRLYDINLEK